MKHANEKWVKLYLGGIEIEWRNYNIEKWHLVTNFEDFDYGYKFRVKPEYEIEIESRKYDTDEWRLVANFEDFDSGHKFRLKPEYEYQWLIKHGANEVLFTSNFFKTANEMINYYGRNVVILDCLDKYKREVKS